MRPQKCLPRGRSLGHRGDAVRLQDPRNRGSPDTMPDVLQCPAHARVAPGGILLGHPHDQAPNLHEDARTTAAPLRVRPLAGDELPMPAENRVGRDDRGDVTKAPTPQAVAVPGQSPAFLVAQAKPAVDVRPQDAVLFNVEHGGRSELQTPRRVSGEDQPTRTYPFICRFIIDVIAHRSIWMSGLTSFASILRPPSACPHARNSTPACFSAWMSAMFGLSFP